MRPDRWQLISRLYNDALACETDKRAAFLRDACGDDEALRQEMESLLARASDASFLSEPALGVIGQKMNDGS